MATDERCLVFHFRECMLSVYANGHGSDQHLVVEVREAPVARKGRRKYADEMLARLVMDFGTEVRRVVIVGDGQGDVYFWKHLTAEVLNKKQGWVVFGLFIDHDDYAEARGFPGNIEFFDTWAKLANRLDILSAGKGLQLTLIDVDRTAIFPRKLADVEFDLVRSRSIVEYLQAFHFRRFDLVELHKISSIVEFCAGNLYGYRNQQDTICFKNEEAVAISALLCATGFIGKEWILQKDFCELGALISFARRRVDERVWAAGLEEDDKFGPSHWDQKLLAAHLSEIGDLLSERSPIISKLYRQAEAVVIDDLCRTSGKVFNLAILEGLAASSKSPIVFLSDRPALSLGLNSSDRLQVLSDLQFKPAVAGLLKWVVS